MKDEFDQYIRAYDGEYRIKRANLMGAINNQDPRDGVFTIKSRLKSLGKSPSFIWRYAVIMSRITLPKNRDVLEAFRNYRRLTVAEARRILIARGFTTEDREWRYGTGTNG